MFLVGVMNGGGGFEYDFEHERHEREEKKFTLILLLGGLFEESVERIGREESLKDGTDEDGEGRFLFEAFEDLIVGTHIDSFPMRRFGEGNATRSEGILSFFENLGTPDSLRKQNGTFKGMR